MRNKGSTLTLKLPIGNDNFANVIKGGFTYVDKSLLVEEVLNQSAQVQLITRPRRFGKTLNMSILAHFFDRGMFLEFKIAACAEQLESALDLALNQIQDRHYAAELEAAEVVTRSEIGVAFCGKQVAVRARHFPNVGGP